MSFISGVGGYGIRLSSLLKWQERSQQVKKKLNIYYTFAMEWEMMYVKYMRPGRLLWKMKDGGYLPDRGLQCLENC